MAKEMKMYKKIIIFQKNFSDSCSISYKASYAWICYSRVNARKIYSTTADAPRNDSTY